MPVYSYICNCGNRLCVNKPMSECGIRETCPNCKKLMDRDYHDEKMLFHITGICKAEFGYARNWDEMDAYLAKEGKPVDKLAGKPYTEAEAIKPKDKKIRVFT